MALITRNPGDTIQSQDVDQFVQLLTGLMADQSLTVPDTVIAGNFTVSAISGPTITSAPLTGTAGANQWWFTVVPVLNGVDGPPGPVFQAPTLGPVVSGLTGAKFYTINFASVAGADGYKLLGAVGATQPALSTFLQFGSTLLPVNGQTTYSMLANSTGSAYTVVTAPLGGILTVSAQVRRSSSVAPTITVLGTHTASASFVAGSTDYAGILVITTDATGYNAGAGNIVTITWAEAFPNTNYALVFDADTAGNFGRVAGFTKTTTTCVLWCCSESHGLGLSTTYHFPYICVG